MSTLDLHAEKKGKFRTVFQNILFISQFMNCFIAARKKPAYRSNEFQFFQQGVGKFIFQVNLSGGNFFVTADQR